MQGGWGAHALANECPTSPRRCVSILGSWGNTIMHAKVLPPPHLFVYNYPINNLTNANVFLMLISYLIIDR